MLGFIFAILAGAAMSIQGVMNTRLQEGIGLWEANAFVQGSAFVLSLIAAFIFGKGNISALFSQKPLYLLGGAFGLAITVCVMLSIKGLSPTAAISVILVSQLAVAAAIDYFGLLGAEKAAFGVKEFIGLALMVGGIILFKIKV
jgi:transporter family-2 protein